jgi:hypothetical protein
MWVGGGRRFVRTVENVYHLFGNYFYRVHTSKMCVVIRTVRTYCRLLVLVEV